MDRGACRGRWGIAGRGMRGRARVNRYYPDESNPGTCPNSRKSQETLFVSQKQHGDSTQRNNYVRGKIAARFARGDNAMDVGLTKVELCARLGIAQRTLELALTTLAILPSGIVARRNVYDFAVVQELERHRAQPPKPRGPRPCYTRNEIARLLFSRWIAAHPGQSIAAHRAGLRQQLDSALRRFPPSKHKADGVAWSETMANKIIESIVG